ncbi:MAG: hypothetical protein SOX33_09880 [Agathobacter sp.]|nr:hypothetical protein [Agathobacter sp.]
MMNWKETKCGKCKIQRARPVCNSCFSYDKFIPIAITNADRIRSFSDEELAEFLCKVKSDYQWADHEFPSEEECGEWVEWLQQEVEE